MTLNVIELSSGYTPIGVLYYSLCWIDTTLGSLESLSIANDRMFGVLHRYMDSVRKSIGDLGLEIGTMSIVYTCG